MAVPTATAELAASLYEAAPEHRATQLVAGLIGGDDPPLVVAIVGQSGVGKSSLVNALAGTAVSDTGVVRPTTTAARSWEAPNGALRLIDAPPSDQSPEDGLAALRIADLGVVVTSHGRYADAATWRCVRAVREAGLPLVVVVNRLEPASADLVTEDVADRLDGEPVIAVHDGEMATAAGRLRELLDAAAGDLAIVRALRRRITAAHAAAAVRSLALEIRIDQERAAVLASAVDDALEVPRPSAADLPPEAAVDDAALVAAVSQLVDTAAEPILASLAAVWERLDLSPPSPAGEVNALLVGDAGHVARWHQETSSAAAAAIRPAFLRRWLAASVGDEAWRAAADPDRRLPLASRMALGRRRHEVLAASRAELDEVLSHRTAARIDRFRRARPTPSSADPAHLEALAGEIEGEYPEVPAPSFLTAVAAR